MAHTYALGAVKPWVRSAAQEVGDKFDVGTIYGVGARAGQSEHPSGRALDFMVYKDRAKGDQIYAYIKQNWSRMGVLYVIWYQRIDEGGGFKPMENRGGTTANHMDHVHVSFTATGSDSGTNTGGGDPAGSGTSDYGAALKTLTAAGTWTRVLMFIAGVALLAVMLWPLISNASGGLL
jgi:hypothetical protein